MTPPAGAGSVAADLLHGLFAHAAVGLAGLDANGMIREANPAFRALLDAADRPAAPGGPGHAGSTEALVGRPLSAWISLEDTARWSGLLDAARRDGTAFAAELRFRGLAAPLRLRVSVMAGGSGFAVVAEAPPEPGVRPHGAAAGHMAEPGGQPAATVCFQAVFEAVPGAYLILSPDRFMILGVSDQYLLATGAERAALLGHPLFEVFPAGAAALPEPVADSLRASLGRVAATGIREWMPLQRWALRPRVAGPAATMRERVWSWLNVPVLNDAGGVDYIIHRTEDVTEREVDRLRLTHALKLQRVAEKTARLGGWEVTLGRRLVTWSEEACAILDLPSGQVSTLREALAFVVPERRAGLRAVFKACVRNGTAFTHEFEIIAARGWRKWIRIVAETERDEAGRVATVSGALQNVSERRAVEEANQRLAERLAARVGSITDAFFTLDSNFRITYANPMAIGMLGLEQGDLLGQSLWECAGFPADGPIGLHLQSAAHDQRTVRFEEFLRPTKRWLDVHAFPAVGGLTVTLYDVTERRHEQEKLRLLEACVARMNDIVLITDANTGQGNGQGDGQGRDQGGGQPIVFVNDAFERRTGFTRAEVYGRTPRILHGPSTQRTELDRIRAALASEQPVRSELINYTRAGEEFWIELDIQPVADRTGAITHWVAVNREITDRRHYQTRLEEQAALLDQVQDGIVVRSIDGIVSYMNHGAERLYGWKAEEVHGQSAARLFHDDPAGDDAPLAAVLAQGAWSGQLTKRRADGTHIVVEARWTLMRNADGSPRAILAVNTDISERLELEARLRQSQRLEAIGQLTGGVAHDFNNLLTVILGNAEILMESLEEDGELREMAEMTMAAAERGAALTSRLLSFSRRQALDPKVVDVNALLASLGAMLRRTIGEQVDLHIVPAAELWHAMIDPPQLESAVLNLCINARDAMPAGGRLTIATRNVELSPGQPQSGQGQSGQSQSGQAQSGQAQPGLSAIGLDAGILGAVGLTASRPDRASLNPGDMGQLGAVQAGAGDEPAPGRYVMIEVVDTGTGMSAEVVARAFEPFFTTKEVGQGSGLGLSMVYGFMKQSGGHVSINSMEGLGTAIRMYIPSAHARVEAPVPGAPAKEAGGRERLLLVEDDALVRDHVAAQLRELGYDVTLVSQASEAMDALRSRPGFDLLFTDIVMPGGMNGLDLAGEARRLHPDLRVLLTSGYTEHMLSEHGPVDTEVRLLRKPYRRRDLAEAIRLALDSQPTA